MGAIPSILAFYLLHLPYQQYSLATVLHAHYTVKHRVFQVESVLGCQNRDSTCSHISKIPLLPRRRCNQPSPPGRNPLNKIQPANSGKCMFHPSFSGTACEKIPAAF